MRLIVQQESKESCGDWDWLCGRKVKNSVGTETDCTAGKQRILCGMGMTVQQESKESCGEWEWLCSS